MMTTRSESISVESGKQDGKTVSPDVITAGLVVSSGDAISVFKAGAISATARSDRCCGEGTIASGDYDVIGRNIEVGHDSQREVFFEPLLHFRPPLGKLKMLRARYRVLSSSMPITHKTGPPRAAFARPAILRADWWLVIGPLALQLNP